LNGTATLFRSRGDSEDHVFRVSTALDLRVSLAIGIGMNPIAASSASYAHAGPYSFAWTPLPVCPKSNPLSRCLASHSRVARRLQLLLRVRTIGVRLTSSQGATMNWDRIEGNWKQFSGKVKQQWGKLTDDDIDVIAGKRDELVGKIQEQYGIKKDEAEQQVDRWGNAFRDEDFPNYQ
jgi:uncharacterized protein YjbJ (UPF0337 family)